MDFLQRTVVYCAAEHSEDLELLQSSRVNAVFAGKKWIDSYCNQRLRRCTQARINSEEGKQQQRSTLKRRRNRVFD